VAEFLIVALLLLKLVESNRSARSGMFSIVQPAEIERRAKVDPAQAAVHRRALVFRFTCARRLTA
jgi:hypothetical protein